MKVVVTGSTGLMGKIVVADLVRHGHDVLGLHRSPSTDPHKPVWQIDLLDVGSLYQAFVGAEAVVHLAAHNAPGLTADTRVFNENVAMTYNVLRASADLGVKSVVIASSVGAYGYLYARDASAPRYLPLDEDHPDVPTDPYGLSKIVSEQIADSFARFGSMSITSLRLPGINPDPEFRRIFKLMADPGFRAKGFWTYVDVRDAARACGLALDRAAPGHRVFNIAAPNSNMREPTAELVRRFWPQVTDLRGGAGNWSGMSSAKAREELGFEAQYTWDKVGEPMVPATG